MLRKMATTSPARASPISSARSTPTIGTRASGVLPALGAAVWAAIRVSFDGSSSARNAITRCAVSGIGRAHCRPHEPSHAFASQVPRPIELAGRGGDARLAARQQHPGALLPGPAFRRRRDHRTGSGLRRPRQRRARPLRRVARLAHGPAADRRGPDARQLGDRPRGRRDPVRRRRVRHVVQGQHAQPRPRAAMARRSRTARRATSGWRCCSSSRSSWGWWRSSSGRSLPSSGGSSGCSERADTPAQLAWLRRPGIPAPRAYRAVSRRLPVPREVYRPGAAVSGSRPPNPREPGH